ILEQIKKQIKSESELGERQGTPWTGRQSVAGPTHRDRQPFALIFTRTFTPNGNLDFPINLSPQAACLWTVGGKRSTRREPTQTRGEHANSTQKDPGLMLELNSGPSCCAATVLTTVPPCCLNLKLVSFKLSKEMVLLQRLQHLNIIKVTVNLEQGNPLQMIQLPQSPWVDRFRVCLDLVRLLHFLSQSPLVSGSLKLTDLDDASFPHRNFTLPCSAWGVCEGLNEKRNIYNAYRYFFTYLLPHQAPPGLTHLVDRIMNATGELKADINQTLEAFEHILHLYKSDLHLENLSPSIIRDHTVMRGMGTSGNVEYRCWPSYSQQSCVLSVHSAREAACICNSHS
uniref:Protein kinase domain containing, cytoplasmic b n=1 Tax=Maylandia zebra TaxID=106582 RepID=A0A3P9DAM3_9CICH